MIKKKVLVIFVICIVTLSIIICYLPLYLRNKEINDLERQGDDLVQKVEIYKKRNHKLPEYLEDMGINLPDNYPLYYNTTQDSGIYEISFQVRPFKSMVYHSDTKQWELQH
jgi:hypothetical protein